MSIGAKSRQDAVALLISLITFSDFFFFLFFFVGAHFVTLVCD